MSLSAFLTVIVANLIAAMSPGPDIILITRIATKSRRHAVAAVLGIQVGVIMWCSLTVLGAAALLRTFPSILGLIQLVGGTWLMWMGWNMLRTGWAARTSPAVDLESAEASVGRLRYAFVQGMTTNLSNPKIVLFLAALIAPLLPAHPSLGLAVLLIASLVISSFLLFLVISFVISTNKIRRRMLRAGPWIDVAAGIFFIVAGATMAVTGFQDVF
ncbi:MULTISPECIES: LysE family translocator [Corynebacterium]|uniref:Lysine transporter LysE n=1 Tax=Corynebacterium flavescens TaxID=28028 RepID=A0A1L7CND3_CORFL|nr:MULTISPECIES: LysE family translocator [Corynebacterium]APT87339.1 lysine transporter LysE [Corynebacterium flavescens]KAA8720809.1 LysE family translocator [Corynebacterium flavescens]MDN6099195.1 LysE family translocator [Corynebacterium flavescens]MDN6199792.1 LysE family translocator [Corynebacterium flavescens]MDN6227337.1 LysE family translocator [Corynebacterium flavescens]